jgi:hypothetical protein
MTFTAFSFPPAGNLGGAFIDCGIVKQLFVSFCSSTIKIAANRFE